MNWAVATIVAVGVLTAGCSTYTDHTREAQRAVVAGNVEQAGEHLNPHLDVDEFDGTPADLDDNRVLFLLERATLLQALGNYGSSSRDLIHIDDRLEWVDFRGETADALLELVYSDDAGPYRAPPHERLLLNSVNMINFLALGQGEGARVEARRFRVMQEYYFDYEPDQVVTDILGFGNYLAGVAFERSQEYSEAVRHYTEAYTFGTWPEPTEDRLLDMINLTGYRGQGLGDRRDRAEGLFERAADRPRVNRATFQERHSAGDTLLVVQTGMVPYRRAERIGLDRAVYYSSQSRRATFYLDSDTSSHALSLHSSGTLNWLNTTTLTWEGLPQRRSVALSIDGRRYRLSQPIDLAGQVEMAWDDIRRVTLAAAISRAVARAVAGHGARKITEVAVEQSQRAQGASRLIGALVGTTLQATLAARDTPDTRSWISLPADIYLVRLPLEPGTQEIALEVNGRVDHRTVEIHPTRLQLFNFSRLR